MMVCGNYVKCQCYHSLVKDLICWRDDDGIIRTGSGFICYPSDATAIAEEEPEESEAEYKSQLRKQRIKKLLDSI